MKFVNWFSVSCFFIFFGFSLHQVVAETKNEEKDGKVTYKSGKKIDFETLLIEGENKNAELSVITGNLGDKDLGLLKLREDFQDYIVDDAGEEIK